MMKWRGFIAIVWLMQLAFAIKGKDNLLGDLLNNHRSVELFNRKIVTLLQVY